MADLKLSVDVSDVQKALTATQRYERQINQLAQRYARGQVSSAAYNRGLLQIKRSYEQLGVSSQKATSEVRRYAQQQLQAARDIQQAAVAQRNFTAATQGAARGINRSGVLTQQAGYQIGDFIVQVQSGTNAFVAFGQQATQVAGTLTLLGGKWILLGSVLGIAIPLLTAIGAAFMRTRGEAVDTTEEINTLSQSISDLNTIQRTTAADFEANLNRAFEDSATVVGRLVESIRELEFRSLRQPINDLVNSLSQVDQLSVAIDTIVALEAQGGSLGAVQQRLLENARNLVRENLVLAIAADDVQQALRNIATAGSTQELIESFAVANDLLSTMSGPLADEMRSALIEAAREAGLLQEVLSLVEGSASEAADESDRLVTALGAAASADLTGLNSQVAFLMQRLGLAADEAVRLNDALPGGGGMVERPGLSFGMGGVDTQGFGDFGSTNLGFGNLPSNRRNVDRTGAIDVPSPGAGAGGGGGTPDFASRVFGPELQAAIEQAQEDLRLYNQEVQMLDSALRAGLITQQEYNSFVSQAQEVYNQAQQGAYDYAEALEQVEKTAMSSMENAFMSIIDGSKSASEAFRDMARQILAEAMRMMVIRPLIQGLFGGGGGGGFLGGIFGGITGGKASGGTMMAGEPYLVGERGPELVMPSRSGTVINADLTRRAMGGSDGVSVVNNINVSGGTDPAAIRQEVAKLMPQITNATKTAVIDARRRGGQMRAAFQ